MNVVYLGLSRGFSADELGSCLRELADYIEVEFSNIIQFVEELKKRGYAVCCSPLPVKPEFAEVFEGKNVEVFLDPFGIGKEVELLGELLEEISPANFPVRVVKTFKAGRVVVVLAERPGSDCVVLLETKVDDVSGEVVANAVDRVMEVALDVEVIHAVGKKGRPSLIFRAIASPERAVEVAEVMMRETGSLGVRMNYISRIKAQRKVEKVKIDFGSKSYEVRVKRSDVNVKPEFEDVRRIAEELGKPILEVYRRVYEQLGKFYL